MTTTHILGDNAPRKSNYDPDLARKVAKYYEEHPEELIDKPEVPPAPTLPASNTHGPLELIEGNYFEAIQAAIPETIQTSAELQKARVECNARKDASLNNIAFYTANVSLYGIENKKPFLLFGGREAFLHLYAPHVEEVYRQLTAQHNYVLPSSDIAWALNEGIHSGALHRFDLAELIETKHDKEYGYFTMNTSKVVRCTRAKRELAELIHGQGNDYFNTFKMFKEKGIFETKVWLLNPDYVSSAAGNNLVGRASRLYSFSGLSSFYAGYHDVGYRYSLRGVREK